MLIRYIIDGLFLLLFRSFAVFFAALVHDFGFHLVAVYILCRFLLLTVFLISGIDRFHFQTLRQALVLAFQVLEQDVIRHLLAELVIFQAAVLDERIDVIPVFLVLFTLGLAHTGQLVCHLLGDVVADLLNETIVLQCGTGYVQRQIRTVDHTLQQHQVFRNDFLDVVGDEHLVVVQLDHTFDGLELDVDLREVQDAL